MNKKICSSILTVAMVATLSVPIQAQETGWIENNGKWTYVTEAGQLASNWQMIGDCWYAFEADGTMKTGWVASDEKWYFMGESGVMQESGWISSEGSDYYLKGTGVMATDYVKDDYELDSTGKAIPLSQTKSVELTDIMNIDNQTIEGNLYIDAAKFKELELSGITVTGKVVILGEVSESKITIKDSTVNTISSQTRGAEVTLSGSTSVKTIEIEENSTIKPGENYTGKVESVEIQSTAQKEVKIEVPAATVKSNTFAPVSINAPVDNLAVNKKTDLKVNADVTNITVNKTAEDTKVAVEKNVTVGSVTSDTKVEVGGAGKVEDVKGNDITNETVKPSRPSTGGGNDRPTPPVDEPITAPKWDGSVDTAWADPEKETYEISTPQQLAGLAKLVNEGNTFLNKTINLTSSLNLDNIEWIPIGIIKKFGFEGTFNGNNHTIYNLVCNKKGYNLGTGLFGYTSDGGELANPVIENLTIHNANLFGGDYVAPLAADGRRSSFINCSVKGTIKVEGAYAVSGLVGTLFSPVGIIENCHVEVEPESFVKANEQLGHQGKNVGGLVGIVGQIDKPATTKIQNSSSNVHVIGSMKVGGLVGNLAANANIASCTVSGTVELFVPASVPTDKVGLFSLGGIVGETVGTDSLPNIISNCTFTGTIVSNENGTAGWLVGKLAESNSLLQVINCILTGTGIDRDKVVGNAEADKHGYYGTGQHPNVTDPETPDIPEKPEESDASQEPDAPQEPIVPSILETSEEPNTSDEPKMSEE